MKLLGEITQTQRTQFAALKKHSFDREKVVQNELKRANINVEKRSLNASLNITETFFYSKETGEIFSNVYIAFMSTDKKIRERKSSSEKMENKLAFNNKRFTP